MKLSQRIEFLICLILFKSIEMQTGQDLLLNLVLDLTELPVDSGSVLLRTIKMTDLSDEGASMHKLKIWGDTGEVVFLCDLHC